MKKKLVPEMTSNLQKHVLKQCTWVVIMHHWHEGEKNNTLLPWAPKLKNREGLRRLGKFKEKKKKKKRQVEKAVPAPEGFPDTHHCFTLMKLGTLLWHCYLESALPRKGQQKSFTLSKHTKNRQPSVFLHFTRELKICPCQKLEK